MSPGKVYLVGAGPGDPDLITWKGRRLLAAADSILYDHLANDALLDLAPPAAERLYVGKKKSAHAYTQDEICAMLIDRAKQGLKVVRLKGGDPFIFGRGGEEAEALADAHVPFEIVPGVTTPLGIAAYSGVPLTHREHTSVVSFVTGHAVSEIDWDKVGAAETLVIFMGLTTFGDIAREIMARGRSPQESFNMPAPSQDADARIDTEAVEQIAAAFRFGIQDNKIDALPENLETLDPAISQDLYEELVAKAQAGFVQHSVFGEHNRIIERAAANEICAAQRFDLFSETERSR